MNTYFLSQEGAIQCASGSVTPAYMGTAASSESGEVGMIMQCTDNGAGYHQVKLQWFQLKPYTKQSYVNSTKRQIFRLVQIERISR